MERGSRVVVAGTGVAGSAAARALLRRGVRVTVVDRAASAAAARLAAEGVEVVITELPPPRLFDGVTELVVSPGFPPRHPLPLAAQAAGVEVYSEPELAWRMRGAAAPPWLAVTGTNGKTTTVSMLASILSAAGLRTAALGNIGEPLVFAAPGPGGGEAGGGEAGGGEAGDGQPGYDVLAVELSSQQLHWSRLLAPQAGALLNLAEDHLEWHGGFEAYAGAKSRIWRGAGKAGSVAVGNLDDPGVADLLGGVRGHAVGFTLGEPGPGQLGLIDGVLVDRAFGAGGRIGGSAGAAVGGERPGEPVRLVDASDLCLPGDHNVANALAAAALARAHGVPPGAVARGLRDFRPQPHRNTLVATIGGVCYVDDSKATNPHAALASLAAYPRVVWIAGGQLKGVDVEGLVTQVAGRLTGVVLLGADRAALARSLTRHAPHLPVVDVSRTDDGAMREVVRSAAALATPGDTVLLAPAAASRDMYTSFAHRGEEFVAAVRTLGSGVPGDAGGGCHGPEAGDRAGERE